MTPFVRLNGLGLILIFVSFSVGVLLDVRVSSTGTLQRFEIQESFRASSDLSEPIPSN